MLNNSYDIVLLYVTVYFGKCHCADKRRYKYIVIFRVIKCHSIFHLKPTIYVFFKDELMESVNEIETYKQLTEDLRKQGEFLSLFLSY